MLLNENKVIDGRYKIIAELGEGSFGETYKAIDTRKLDEIVVVKRLRIESYSGDYQEKAKNLFKREAEAYMKLGSNCSQIPRLEAYLEENNNFYLVMEYIEGSNLSEQELQERNKLEEKHLINLLKNILKIIQIVHNHNLVHRDIKPDNLIVRNSDKTIALIDFGAVTNDLNIKHKEQTTGQKTNLGSIYTAPEQLLGEAHPCSDIYAVGMISIQALTGRRPENLPTDPITGERIWEHLTSASGDLKRVIRKMVYSNASERYQSVDEVLKDIDKIDNQSPKINNFQPISVLPSKVVIDISVIVLLIISIIMNIFKYIPPKYFYKLKHVTRDDMNNLCHNENYYKRKIFEQRPDLKNITGLEFNVEGLKLNPNDTWGKIIPAYRWKCVYQPMFKDTSKQGVLDIVTIGLDMDESICQKKYAKEGLIHATFLHYDDPDSIYCILTKIN